MLIKMGDIQNVSLVWIRQENKGVSAARNLGLQQCTGEYVLFHDSDDLLDDHRVELQVATLARTGADLCASSIQRFATDGRGIFRHYIPAAKDPDRLSEIEIKRMHWGTPMFMYRRSVLGDIWWDEGIQSAEDIFFNFNVLNQDVHVCLEPLAITKTREHNDGLRLKSREGGLASFLLVHRRMMDFYRSRGMTQHLAIEQLKVLKVAGKIYANGNKQKANAIFKEIQPFVSSEIPGGIGEQMALRLRWCGLYFCIRKINHYRKVMMCGLMPSPKGDSR